MTIMFDYLPVTVRYSRRTKRCSFSSMLLWWVTIAVDSLESIVNWYIAEQES